ncbi:unnamed protein product [Calypogeia fissa]
MLHRTSWNLEFWCQEVLLSDRKYWDVLLRFKGESASGGSLLPLELTAMVGKSYELAMVSVNCKEAFSL